MDDIKVGMIGLGYWGPKLARNFHECRGADLNWACDLRPDRLQHISGLYPAVCVTQDYAELLRSDVDAVCIATPVSTHYPLALAALRAGKHVLVEKPLAANVAEAEEIVAEGQKRGLTVMVGHTFVYNPAVVAMQQIIARRYLGDVYYVDAARVNLGLFQPDINVVWDLAPHDISILLFVLGMEPESVSVTGGVFVQRHKGIHDVAYLTFHFPKGLLAQVRVSWLDPCKIRRYTVVGSERMLVYDDVDPRNKLSIYDKGVDAPPYSDTEAEFHLSYRIGEATPYPIEWVEPLRVECEHFLECVRRGTESRSGGQAALQVVRVLEAAQRSLLNDGHLEVVR